MKTILIILFIDIFLCAKTPYWVQVIAVKHPSSLTKHFLIKTKKCYKNYHIVHKNGYEKVWLGKFDTIMAANKAKKYFQTCLTKNAFVVSGKISGKHIQNKLVAIVKNKSIKEKEVGKLSTPQIVKIVANTVSLQINTKSLAQNKIQNKIRNPAVKQCITICKKQQLRQSEIALAIEYYKHSKYYNFSAH